MFSIFMESNLSQVLVCRLFYWQRLRKIFSMFSSLKFQHEKTKHKMSIVSEVKKKLTHSDKKYTFVTNPSNYHLSYLHFQPSSICSSYYRRNSYLLSPGLSFNANIFPFTYEGPNIFPALHSKNFPRGSGKLRWLSVYGRSIGDIRRKLSPLKHAKSIHTCVHERTVFDLIIWLRIA